MLLFSKVIKMKIALGCDHGGYELKNKIIDVLKTRNIEYHDFGCYSEESVDYPKFAKIVGEKVASKEYDLGILTCGTGIGISIAANKVKGVRASLVHDKESAKLTRQHNNSNVLCMGGRIVDHDLALEITKLWLDSEFEGGRHQRRIDQIEEV